MNRFSTIALVLLAATCADAAERKLDRTFAVSPGGALIVDADSASVHVSGNDTNQVIVRMSAQGSEDDLAETKLDAVQNANQVTVILRRGRKGMGWFNWNSWNGDQYIEISVPRRFDVDVRTGGGDVKLRDTSGSAKLRTSGGDIEAKNANGSLVLRTSGGEIVADTVQGEVDADTSGGDVRLMKVDGKIRGHTSGGSVRCSLVGINRGISATTSGGDIELTLPRSVTGNLHATTSGGDVDSEIPVLVTATKEHQLIGPVNGGGPPIEARTSGGNIRLRAAN